MFTFLHSQIYVDFIVVEHPRYLDPAAVHASVARSSIQNCQGHVSITEVPQELVPGLTDEAHHPIFRVDDPVWAFKSGDLSSTPTEAQETMSLGTVGTGHRDIVPYMTTDFESVGANCIGRHWITALKCEPLTAHLHRATTSTKYWLTLAQGGQE